MPGTVTVASKLPYDLKLRVFAMRDEREPVMGGGFRDVKVGRDTGQFIMINGVAAHHGRDRRDAAGNPVPVASGFALTHNVDADKWMAWLADNKDSDMVRNGLIFAHQKDTAGQAREHEKIRSGLEAMNPDGDPRNPRRQLRTSGGTVDAVATAARAA